MHTPRCAQEGFSRIGVPGDRWPLEKHSVLLDVGMAFVLAIVAYALIAITQGKVNKQATGASYRTYRFLTHGLPVMIVVFFLLTIGSIGSIA
jgi:hypothetical protein